MSEYFLDRSQIKEDIKHLVKQGKFEKINNGIFLAKVLMVYFFIFTVFYCNYWMYNHYGFKTFYFLPFFIIVIGCLQYIIAQAAHEAIHFHIQYENDLYSILCAFLMLYPIGITKNYKKSHMLHHIHFGDREHDPDYLTFMVPPSTKRKFWFMLLESFLGISTAKRLVNLYQYQQKKKKQNIMNMQRTSELFKLISVQLILFLTLLIIGMGWGYFVLWILPLVLVTKSLVDIRLLAEHGPMGKSEPALRSFLKKDSMSHFLGVFGFKFHAEHHLFPGVPYYKLHKLSAIIQMKAGQMRINKDEHRIELSHLSYIEFLKKYYFSLSEK